MINILFLAIGMFFILIAAMVFCNALEHLGEYLGISEGVTGSIFVAVGTALPETLMPIIALLNSFNQINPTNNVMNEIGIGAILGPPLMLSSLSIALMAFSVIKQRGWNGLITPEKTGLKRDFKFFIFGYSLAILLAFSHNYYNNRLLDAVTVICLCGCYFFYVLLTIKASDKLVEEGFATKAEDPLILNKYLKLPTNIFVIIIQIIISFIGLVYFAHVFIDGINNVAALFAIPQFLLAVILIPIATELPEKVNSILWIRKGKDTLAVSNITGAMVFQGLLLPALGIVLTTWKLQPVKLISCIITFVAVFWLLFNVYNNRQFKVWHFAFNGILYIISLVISIWMFKS